MSRETIDELKQLQDALLEAGEDWQPAKTTDISLDDILNDAELNALLNDTPETEPPQAEEPAPQEAPVQIYANEEAAEVLYDTPDGPAERPERSLTGLIVAALLLTAGLVGVAIYVLIRYA